MFAAAARDRFMMCRQSFTLTSLFVYGTLKIIMEKYTLP